MLAVTANWGLSDGSLGGTGADQASGWLDAVRFAAIRGGCGIAGRYRPIERLALVFAGDTFDLLLSDRWSGRDRPWHGGRRARLIRREVVAAAVRLARRPLARLRSWGSRGLSLPASDARGRPVARQRCRAAVDLIVLLGDRDAGLAAWGPEADRMGVRIGDVWAGHGYAICHGQELDPLRFRPEERTWTARSDERPSLAESIAVDLLVPFAVAVRAMPAAWPLVRPILGRLVAAGARDMVSILADTCSHLPPGIRQSVTDAWRRAVGQWFDRTRRDPPTHAAGFDATAPLAGWFADGVADWPAVDRYPTALHWLEIARPTRSDGARSVFGHLGVGGKAGGTSIGLAAELPWLLVQPSPDRPPALVRLGPEERQSAIVRVGTAAGGDGWLDAA